MTTKAKTGKAPSASASKKKVGTQGAKKTAKALPRAEGPQCFWVTDGQVLADVLELHRSLQKMSEDVFRHHVTKDKNDFADWVEHVLNDRELASALRKSKQPESACTVISRRLKVYGV